MIGYHYTSYSNWNYIKSEGLLPYDIRKKEFRLYIKDGKVNGIWIWRKKLEGIGHVGSILWQVASKEDPIVVLLKVVYSKDHRLKLRDIGEKKEKLVELSHEGYFGKWEYHTGEEKAFIYTRIIPPEDIELVKIFNIMKLLK